MNSTPNAANTNAKLADAIILLQDLGGKTSRKLGKTEATSFAALLNEKSAKIEGKTEPSVMPSSEQSSPIVSKKAKLPDGKRSIGSTLENEVKAPNTKVSQSADPMAKQTEDPISSIFPATGENTDSPKLGIIDIDIKGQPTMLTATVDATPQMGDQTIRPGSSDIEKKYGENTPTQEMDLPSLFVAPDLGNKPNHAEPSSQTISVSLAITNGQPNPVQSNQEPGVQNPAEIIPSNQVLLPSPNVPRPEPGDVLSPETAPASPNVLSQKAAPASPSFKQVSDREIPQALSQEASLADIQDIPTQAGRNSSDTVKNTAEGRENHPRLDGITGKKTISQNQVSSESMQNRASDTWATIAVDNSQQDGTKNNTTGESSKAPLTERIENRIVAASSREQNPSAQMVHGRENRAISQPDATISALASKDATYMAVGNQKESTPIKNTKKETASSKVSDTENQYTQMGAPSRVSTLKELANIYTASVELEKDGSKTTASKTNITDKADGSVGMKPFSEYSPVFTPKSVGDTGLSGVKAQAVIDQIADARQQMPNDSGRIKITLTPPNLGTVELEVVVRQNRVEVTMTADQSSVQQLLQSRGEDIKTALQRQDMKVETYQVLLQNNADGNQQQSSAWNGMQEHSGKGHSYYTHENGFTGTDIAPDQTDLPVQHTKGLVSIFA